MLNYKIIKCRANLYVCKGLFYLPYEINPLCSLPTRTSDGKLKGEFEKYVKSEKVKERLTADGS
jgi:hypothetical protein